VLFECVDPSSPKFQDFSHQTGSSYRIQSKTKRSWHNDSPNLQPKCLKMRHCQLIGQRTTRQTKRQEDRYQNPQMKFS